MANSCVLTMYYADCTGNAKNNKYSHRIDVVDTASLQGSPTSTQIGNTFLRTAFQYFSLISAI